MANLRDLRTRTKSISNIAQITRAMEMVASTKLRKFQDRALASRPYAEQISKLVSDLAGGVGDDNPLFEDRSVKKRAVLVVTSNRGLCGSYNSNLFTLVRQHAEAAKERGEQLSYFVIGKKGFSYLSKRDFHISFYLEELNLEKLEFADARRVAATGVDLFHKGAFDALDVLYTSFVTPTRFEPDSFQFLPLVPEADEEGNGAAGESILEPSRQEIFDSLVPKHLEVRIFSALLQSLTSEFAMRRIAMKNATDAANDYRKELQKLYNRARQERITKELLEIVGGAEALKG